MDINNSNLPLILSAINKFSTSDLSGSDIANIINVKRSIKDCADSIFEAQSMIFDHYGIVNKDGVVSWSHHDKADEISTKMKEVMESTSKISASTKMNVDIFYSSVSGMSINEIELLTPIFT